jgi:hypothetical protein
MGGPVLWPILAALVAQTTPPPGGSAEPAVDPVGGDPIAAPAPPPSPGPPADSRDDRPTRWYGAATVAADAATIGLLFATSAYADSYQRSHGSDWSGAPAVYGLLGAAYILNGAVAHGLNHQPRRAGGSILLRVSGVVVGFVTGASIIVGGKCFQSVAESDGAFPSSGSSSSPAFCYVGVASLFAFPLAALAIDDAYLARAPVEEAPPPHASIAPSLVVKPGLALLGLGASF